jgi:DNA-binding transcriptional MocR family regulator
VADAHTRGKLQWLDAVATDRRIAHLEFRVAYQLASKYLNRITQTAWPSHKRLADDLGLNEKTVRTALKNLRDAGYLRWTSGRGRKITNEYELMPVARTNSPGKKSGAYTRFSTPQNRVSDVAEVGQGAQENRANDYRKNGSTDPTNPLMEPSEEPSDSTNPSRSEAPPGGVASERRRGVRVF